MPRISDFPIKSNPSTSATLSGVDGGENVQIPTSVFAKKTDIPSVSGLASTSYVDTKLQTFCGDLINGMDAEGNTLKVGCAEEADRINRKNVGSATQPVYFLEGVPVATTLATVATSGSYNDLSDKPTIPSAYSHPDTHPASMIAGLSKVATSGSYNDLTDKPTIPSGGGSGGASIIYATEKPSTPQQAIYVVTEDEVVKVELYQSQILPETMACCEIVDALPEIGVGAMDLTTNTLYTYYLTTDGELYGYVDGALEAAGGVPVGWYPVAPLFGAVGTTYGGQITSTDQATDASTMYALLTKQPKTRVYVPMPDGTFLELTSGIRTRFDGKSRTVSITEV